jgi:hypothetical protein
MLSKAFVRENVITEISATMKKMMMLIALASP